MEPCRSRCLEREPEKPEENMSKTILSRFGEVEYDLEKVIHFPTGLVGFEHLRDFVVIPQKKEGPLFWIQSVEDSAIAFVLTDPTNFFLDYTVAPDDAERGRLGIGESDECLVLSVVTVTQDRRITLNLAAPVLFAPKTNRALQVILEKTDWKHNEPLPAA